MYGAGHVLDFINRMRFNRSQLKHRKKFKSDEKYFHVVEVSPLFKQKKYKKLKQLSEEELVAYKQKMHARLRRERRLFLLKMLIGILILGGLAYWVFTGIF